MKTLAAFLAAAALSCISPVAAQSPRATVREYERAFPTYPFGDPNPIPVVGRIWPYFRFDGFAHKSEERKWKVVELENDHLRVMILPEIGGKIWDAVDKRTGRSFIYFNRAVKFRDIAMRGPWTSGGIEANYGIIGHTPNVATPVDYLARENPDGSVSCVIGALDLLTRTPWRLEIRLGPDDAAFSTTSSWYNASPVEQPYYSWMNVGIRVSGNLQFVYPGTSYLGHGGEHGPWPVDAAGRDLSRYENNDFGGYKSYHVFGQATDFFGAWWHDDDFGMVRYAPRDEKAGKKIWIWGLSRQGMIWEQLLTDADGQYAEVQSGRLFNQSVEQSTMTPFKHRGFAPHTADRWTEWWYPVAGTKGIAAAGRVGALNVASLDDRLIVTLSPVVPVADTLRVYDGDRQIHAVFVERKTLELFVDTVSLRGASPGGIRVAFGDLLGYRADRRPDSLARPLDAPPAFDWKSAYGHYLRGKEWIRQREYGAARSSLDSALSRDPNFVPALADRAMLAIRSMEYDDARRFASTALSVDTYDGASNYYYGLANRRLGSLADAKDGFEIATMSPEYRGAAWTELGRLALAGGNTAAAPGYADKALGAEGGNLDALGVAIVAARRRGDGDAHGLFLSRLESVDPLSHQARLERLLSRNDPALVTKLAAGVRSELPEQTLLELAAWYADAGDADAALLALEAAGDRPEALYWRAYLADPAGTGGDDLLARANGLSPKLVFPFRPEIVPVLGSAAKKTGHWKPSYYLALAHWGIGRTSDAESLLVSLGNKPDYAPFYAARATFPGAAPAAALADLRRAAEIDGGEWRYGDLLAKRLLASGDAKGAVEVARRYRDRFPGNYIVGLTLARSFVAAGKYGDADALLGTLDVLPYEGAADGRALYRQAKLMLAAEAVGAKKWERATELIAAARLWPERLGAGKPYDADADERLEDWLLADVLDRSGKGDDAVAAWTKLAAGTMATGTASDVLKAWALDRLGRPGEAAAILDRTGAGTYTAGADGAVVSRWLATSPPKPPPRETTSPSDTLWYGTGAWEPDSLGNHRAVLRVPVAGDAVHARIPWRRRDRSPEKVNLVVASASTGVRVRNVARLDINREYGDIVFQANSPGDYYVYYMPYTGTFRSPYPKIAYRTVEQTAEPEWIGRNGLTDASRSGPGNRAMDEKQPTDSGEMFVQSHSLPRAAVIGFDAVDRFSRFTPMEYIAGAAEIETLSGRHPSAGFLAFAEDRSLSIRMTDEIPRAWAERGAFRPFTGESKRGEFYAFQIGVWAHRGTVDSLRYRAGAFTRRGGPESLPASSVTSINFEGIDWSGRPFHRTLRVDSGKVQPLWFGVDVPADAVPGDYEGTITLSGRGGDQPPVDVVIRVGADAIANHGDDEPDRLTRLRWLNSQLAADDSVTAPFIPMRVEGTTVSLLGRSLTFGPDGLPAGIRSFFSANNTSIATTSREILQSPMRLVVLDSAGREVALNGAAPVVTKSAPGIVAWETDRSSTGLRLTSRASLEFDGTAEYTVTLTAAARTPLSDVRLEIPMCADAARYLMGLGRRGGLRNGAFRWKWDVAVKNQDALWIGDVNAGLQFTLKDDSYVRPLNTNFYLSKPLIAPRSWANGGRGGVDVDERGDSVVVLCYTGSRVMEAGDSLRFDFRLMITPFKPLDTQGQWGTRYFHAFVPPDSAARSGANTINIHHANRVNPWINYPFLEPAAMRSYIDSARALGMKAKIYYTVRELTNHAPELFALRSLGDEVLSRGPGGGGAWLQEHVGFDYIGAWHVFEIRDAALVNSGVSRWHNFYIEGLNWLVGNETIDGLYLDDVAFDRLTMKRVRRVLDRGNPGSLIDLHSANQYNPRDGFASSANLYLEHFPFINRLWFGEYFDYDSPPDYWLVEVSGIPFGLMGEMLEKGGHPWRGMTFGITARLPWAGDPGPLWKAWDDFGIKDSRMQGWWSGADPVTTGDTAVLATTWIKPGSAMVSLGSWRYEDARVRLAIDWKAIGLDPARTTVRAPAIPSFQEAGSWKPDALITVPAGKGLLLMLEER